MKLRLALAAVALIALLTGITNASAFANCNPTCPSGYSQQGSVDC